MAGVSPHTMIHSRSNDGFGILDRGVERGLAERMHLTKVARQLGGEPWTCGQSVATS